MLIIVGEAEAGVGRDVKRANKLYQEEKYDEALGLYDKALKKEPNDQAIQYNRAAALYRKNEFAKSAEAFLRSLAGVDESIEEKAMYNVGNSEFRLGEGAEKQDPASAMSTYKKALEYYKRSMRVSPDDRDAKYNYEFTLQKIKEMEQQQQQQQQQEQQQKQKEEEKKKEQEKQKEQEQKEQEQREQEREEQERKEQEQREKEQFPKQQKPDTMDELEREMSEEEAEMLLRLQDEEETRLRDEMKKAKKGRRPPVVRDW
ncbi:MAG: tetratricopeptide repeat protein [Candidatus Omnitrophota bacterium]